MLVVAERDVFADRGRMKYRESAEEQRSWLIYGLCKQQGHPGTLAQAAVNLTIAI